MELYSVRAGYLTDQKQSVRARVMDPRSMQKVGIVRIPKQNWVYSVKSGYLNKVLRREYWIPRIIWKKFMGKPVA